MVYPFLGGIFRSSVCSVLSFYGDTLHVLSFRLSHSQHNVLSVAFSHIDFIDFFSVLFNPTSLHFVHTDLHTNPLQPISIGREYTL